MFKNIKNKIIYVVGFSMLSLNAVCEEISYNYIQGSYMSISVNPDEEDFNGDGFGLSGSFGISNNLALTVGYSEINFDRIFGVDFDRTELALGFIAHMKASSEADLFVGLEGFSRVAKASNGFTTFKQDDFGNKISAGIRNKILKNLELNISVVRSDVFDHSIVSFVLGAQLYANKKYSLGAYLSSSDEEEIVSFNFRVDL